jgi:acyl dehydratase
MLSSAAMTGAAFEVGNRFELSVPEPLTRERVRAYAEASGDMSRIHLDDDFARQSGLNGIIVHGMFTVSLVVESVLELFGAPTTVEHFDVRFSRAFEVGGQLHVDVELTEWNDGTTKRTATLQVSGRSEDTSAGPYVTGVMSVAVPR